MEGIEKITARISDDTRRELEEMEAAARVKAAEIEAAYRERAAQETANALARGRRAAGERLEQLHGAARLEAKKQMLAVRQELVNEAFSRALTQLCGMPEDEYVAYLVHLAATASLSGGEQLIFSPRDRTRFGKKVVAEANARLEKEGRPAHLTLSQESRTMKGGLILSDGDVEINCSFETTLRLMRRELSHQVADALFL